MDTDPMFPRFPGPKSSIASFAAVSGPTDAILVAVTNPLLMAIIEGIDVAASSSGTTTEFFTIDVWESSGTVFKGTIFSNQVSPPTGLSFSWRGHWPVYSNQQIKLHSVSGPWTASAFGFLVPADNVAH